MRPGVATLSNLPSFDTCVPFIGKVDLNDKMEWVYWGSIAATMLFVKAPAKWIIAAGILALRYELQKGGQS